MTGASGTKIADLFGVVRRTVSKVITAFENERKTRSLKQIPGRKRKLSDRDNRTLTLIVGKDHKNTAPKIKAELNDHLENPVSRTVIRKPYKSKFIGNFLIFTLFCPTPIYIYFKHTS